MTNRSSAIVAGVVLFALLTQPVLAAGEQMLHGHVPGAIANLHLQSIGRLPATNNLNLTIGLPLRNKESLDKLLQQIYDPTSTNFHKYLTPAQFTESFGPTEDDYQRVVNFAKSNHLEVKKTYSDRVLLDVEAPVSAIESVFHVTMQTYQHPTEARQFFAPDVEPSVGAEMMPAVFISGLNNFYKPHTMSHLMPALANGQTSAGSAPDHNYIGNDFMSAYVPGVTLNGAGQMVGLVEFEGYYASDITNYENLAGISTSFPLQNVVLPGFSIKPNDSDGIMECSLDIEMVMSMARGLSTLYVFEGTNMDQILSSMVSSNQIEQFSCSWGVGYDPTADAYLMQMGVQGQSFFEASGDGDAWISSNMTGDWPCDDPYVTSVGGTALTMNGSGASYASEQVWNSGSLGTCNGWSGNPDKCSNTYWGSGGGVSPNYSIPSWQQGVNTIAVGGSSTKRNIPDVALTADNVWVNYNHTTTGAQGNYAIGTSIAAPLWAGFTALVNQLAASQGLSSVGFLNPSLYAFGEGSSYNSCFNDITGGNNFWSGSPSAFNSATGYDLCTGWGTPKGVNLIISLMAFGSSVWVDFNYTGSTSDGTYNFPFKTLAGGINAVPTGGNIWIRSAGSTPETMSITKPLTIRAFNGAATIGQ